MGVRFEHLVLFLGGQPGEQRHDLDRVGAAHIRCARTEMMMQGVFEIMDIALAGREDEDVPRPVLMAGTDDQFGAGARHGGRHIGLVVVTVAIVAAAPVVPADCGIARIGEAGHVIHESRQ